MSQLVLPVNADNKTKIENDATTIKLQIDYANYLDYDGDGFKDDVIGNLSLNIFSDFNSVYFYLDSYLILPSGMTFSQSYSIWTNITHLKLLLIFINSATEAGWYDLIIVITIYQGGYASGSAIYTFDPPELDPGGDPV